MVVAAGWIVGVYIIGFTSFRSQGECQIGILEPSPIIVTCFQQYVRGPYATPILLEYPHLKSI